MTSSTVNQETPIVSDSIRDNLKASVKGSSESILALLSVLSFIILGGQSWQYQVAPIHGIAMLAYFGLVLVGLDALRRLRTHGIKWELVELGILLALLAGFAGIYLVLSSDLPFVGNYYITIMAAAFTLGLVFILKVARRGDLDYTPVVGYLLGINVVLNFEQVTWMMVFPMFLAVAFQAFELWRDRNWQAPIFSVLGIPFMFFIPGWTGALIGVMVVGFVAPTLIGWLSSRFEFLKVATEKMVVFGVNDTKTEKNVELLNLHLSIEGAMTFVVLQSTILFLTSII
jgi:hypothetical protein